MKKLLYALSIGALFSCCDLYGQTTKSSNTQEEKTLEQKLEGTFVLIHTSNKKTQLVTTDILVEIEKRRDENIDIYYRVSDYLTIKILPKKVISAPDFDPKKFQ